MNAAKEKDGQVPVMGRITINGSIAQFSCKQSINLTLWDAKSNRATGKSDQAVRVNRALDNIRAQITKHYQYMSDREGYVSAEKVKNAYLGIGTACDTLVAAMDKHNAEYKKRVGKDRVEATYIKYTLVRRHLADFIKSHYRRTDMMLREIDESFIDNFTIYLRSYRNLAPSTVWVYCIPLKMIVTKAHNSGNISTNPFAYYHIRSEVGERGYLSESELECLMKHRFTNPYLAVVRDIFVFACFTGLSYIDIKKLTAREIETTTDGAKWIVSRRQKTKTPFRVKLLDVPLQLIEYYSNLPQEEGRLFRTPINRTCNLRLKAIAKECGIGKNLHFHMSRHGNYPLRLKTSKLYIIRSIPTHISG